MLESINFMSRLIMNILFFFGKSISIGLKLSSEIELMQDELDAIFDIFDYVMILSEKLNMIEIYLIVFFQIFFNADVQIRFVYDFDVVHIFIYDILVYLSNLFS